MAVPVEINAKATGLRWVGRCPRKLKYVDDGMIVCKVNMRTGELILCPGSKPIRRKHDALAQNMFRRVIQRATERGMVVNNKKTNILCVSDAISYKAESFVDDPEGMRVSSRQKLCSDSTSTPGPSAMPT